MQVMGYAIVGGRAMCSHHPQRPRARLLRDALVIDKQPTRDNACKISNVTTVTSPSEKNDPYLGVEKEVDSFIAAVLLCGAGACAAALQPCWSPALRHFWQRLKSALRQHPLARFRKEVGRHRYNLT